MSIGGRYKYNPVTKEMEKISDKVTLRKPVHWKSDWDHSGFYSESCDVHFKSKDHKRQVLREKNWAEAG